MSLRSVLRYLAIAATAVVLALALVGGRGGPSQGSEAVTFTAKMLGAKDDFDLAAHQGRTVVLDFWATWCPPCRRTLPVLQRAFLHYAMDPSVQIISVNTDAASDRVKLVDLFMKRHKYSFPVLLDDGQISEAYNVKSIPLLVVIGPSGVVRYVEVGARLEPKQAYEMLRLAIEAAQGES